MRKELHRHIHTASAAHSPVIVRLPYTETLLDADDLTHPTNGTILSMELSSEEYISRASIFEETTVTPPNRIQWLSDLVRVEIVLWDHINARLHQDHDLSLAFFETLYFIGHSPDGSLRVGDLARALRITVGATSKLIDRVEAARLIRRELDADDRRASRVVLSDAGKQKLAEASTTYTTALASLLDATLTADEQLLLHTLVRRLLTAAENGESV
jgi:DNA-binding MarR family transcriptional regulator